MGKGWMRELPMTQARISLGQKFYWDSSVTARTRKKDTADALLVFLVIPNRPFKVSLTVRTYDTIRIGVYAYLTRRKNWHAKALKAGSAKRSAVHAMKCMVRGIVRGQPRDLAIGTQHCNSWNTNLRSYARRSCQKFPSL